jgi:hypothetical protein
MWIWRRPLRDVNAGVFWERHTGHGSGRFGRYHFVERLSVNTFRCTYPVCRLRVQALFRVHERIRFDFLSFLTRAMLTIVTRRSCSVTGTGKEAHEILGHWWAIISHGGSGVYFRLFIPSNNYTQWIHRIMEDLNTETGRCRYGFVNGRHDSTQTIAPFFQFSLSMYSLITYLTGIECENRNRTDIYTQITEQHWHCNLSKIWLNSSGTRYSWVWAFWS